MPPNDAAGLVGERNKKREQILVFIEKKVSNKPSHKKERERHRD